MDPTDLLNYAAAIRAIESSGNYRSLGPITKRGDRAYGAYQVMGSNIPDWTKGALGYSMTPDQFLGDKNAQDTVFKKYFGDNLQKYGNPNDAASVWFTGRPQALGGNASDGYIDGNEYVKRFSGALAAARGQAPVSADAEDDTLPAGARPVQYQPQQPSWADGLSGLGGSLQEAGAFLMGKPGEAASIGYANQAKRRLNQGQLVDMGTDPLTGQKNWALFDPNTQSFKPFGGSAQGASGEASGGTAPTMSGGGSMDTPTFMANIKKVQAGQMTPEDFKSSLNPMIVDYAQALVEGKADPRMLGNRAAQLRPYALMAAHVLDPNFNENQISARQAEAKNLATSNNPNTLGGAIASLGKVSLHGQELLQASKDLSDRQVLGGEFNTLNSAENILKKRGTNDQDYKAKLNSLTGAAELFAREADRLTSGGHPTLAGQKAITDLFTGDLSHDERVAAVKKVLSMAQEATDQLVYNNNNAFGRIGTGKEKAVDDFMSPATLKAWKDVQSALSPAEKKAAKKALPAGVTSIELIP